jgi:repressor LexA
MEEEMNKQTEIYEFLKTYTENKGYPPSVREICEAVSLRSTSTVHVHLKRLEKKGLVKRDPTKPRALEIAELSANKEEMISIPIVRKIMDGDWIFQDENIENTVQLPLDYIKRNKGIFMFKVFDNSMININIRKNDSVIIGRNEIVKNGDIVIAQINDYITIKRFFKEKNCVRLQPENDEMESIVIDDCKILGKVIGSFRSYD